jgi:hypothetical protein
MRRSSRFALLPLACVFSACTRPVNTLPPVPTASSPLREILLDLPDSLEIRSVDFDAALYSDVSGGAGEFNWTSTSVGGRAFVKVLAVHRRTGETMLLLYENVGRRTTPTQIIRFRTGGALPAPAGTAPSPPP